MSLITDPFSPNSKIIVNLNGQLLQPGEIREKAKVSVFDRSYVYGDSLYEVCRTYGSRWFGLEEHLKRMEQSAALCHMELGQSLDVYAEAYQRSLEAFRALPGMADREAYGRIILSRGEGRIGFGLNCVSSPTLYTLIVQPLEPPTAEQFEKGYSYNVIPRLRNNPRALDPAMKSGNYLNSLLGYLEAADERYLAKGSKLADDALLCNGDGHLTEGTTFNIFYVNRGIVATPPLDIGILDGISRRLVLDLCEAQGIEAREVRFPKERLYEADEVFMTSTIKEVFPVTKIDGKLIKGGKPGPITRKLNADFKSAVEKLLA